MSHHLSAISLPPNQTGRARLSKMSEELARACSRTDQKVLRAWAIGVVGDFTSSLGRRVNNVRKLAGRVVIFNVSEIAGASQAYREDRLVQHTKDRGSAAWSSLRDLFTKSRDAGAELIAALRKDPSALAPHLLAMVVTSLVVSGGPDGDGGAPDLDLLGGIGAHRAIWTHSILMGATLEAAFLALVRLVHLVHENLPADHDEKWDTLARHSQNILAGINKGASVGLSYHFLTDGLVQSGTYHGLPFSMPHEAHEALQTVNGVAEALDATHKDQFATKPIWFRLGAQHWPWAQRGYIPARSKSPEYHRVTLRKPFLVDGRGAQRLSAEELRIVQKYGSWMEALTSEDLMPLTPEQEHFVQVAWGREPVHTEHERAWTKYLTGAYVAA
jgi:hypothetical protein